MKICPKCKQVNEDKAQVCYNCGQKFVEPSSMKRLAILLMSILIIAAIGAVGYGLWYFMQPEYYLYPEIDGITMDGDGETKEINVTTNAPYNEWEAHTYNNWISVSKKSNSIIITCDANNSKKIGDRHGTVYLCCESGRKDISKAINIKQGEDTKTIRGEIKKVDAYYTNNSEYLGIEVKCDIHNWPEEAIKCALWFYHEDGTKLIDTNREYCTSDGQVTVQEYFYKDESFFLKIPISELHLSKSEDIKISVGLFEYESDDEGRQFVSEDNTKTFHVAL